MKRITVAVLFIVTLFVFTSCDNGISNSAFPAVPQGLWGTWEYSAGEGMSKQTYVISENNIVFHSNENDPGVSLFEEGLRGQVNLTGLGSYDIQDTQMGYRYLFQFHHPNLENGNEDPNTLIVRTFNYDEDGKMLTPTEIRFTLVTSKN